MPAPNLVWECTISEMVSGNVCTKPDVGVHHPQKGCYTNIYPSTLHGVHHLKIGSLANYPTLNSPHVSVTAN